MKPTRCSALTPTGPCSSPSSPTRSTTQSQRRVAFDDNEGLAQVSNWLFLTGSLKQLETTWSKYGVQAQVEPAGSMVAHTELAYVIDPSGHAR